MTVYIDDMELPFRGMLMCHMVADTHEELEAMAQQLGLRPEWLQLEGTYKEHYDVCKRMAARALELGAVRIGWREMGRRLLCRRRDSDAPSSGGVDLGQPGRSPGPSAGII